MTPAQHEAASRMNAQRSFKTRKVLLQHSYGLPIRNQTKKK